jgi:hypothetical protein
MSIKLKFKLGVVATDATFKLEKTCLWLNETQRLEQT